MNLYAVTVNVLHEWDQDKKLTFVSVCRHCGSKRHLERQAGWPSWYTYFTPSGGYSGKEGSEVPPCSRSRAVEVALSGGDQTLDVLT